MTAAPGLRKGAVPQPDPLRNPQPTPRPRPVRTLPPEHVWWRLLTLPVLVALATGIAPYATGAPLSRSIGIGLTLGAVTWLVIKSLTVPAIEWPQPPVVGDEWGRTARQWEVPGLDAALERPQYMSRRALTTMLPIARDLLARRGLQLDGARSRELLGDRGTQLLTVPDCSPPSRAELSVLIDRLTRIGAGEVSVPPAPPVPGEPHERPAHPLPVPARLLPRRKDRSR